VGNRLAMTNAGEVTYTYDANNKLTQLVGPSGTTTFGYDNNGNMTGMNLPDETVWAYGYDYENRLVSVADNSDYTAAYTYGPNGLRLRVQESNNPNPDRWFQYDGVRPVLEGTLSEDTFTAVNRYAWEGGSYYDPLISASIGGEDRFYVFDGLGSTRQLLDGDQAVTDSYSYEAFGNVLSDGGPTPNPYRYVGSLGYYQTGSSLMHLGARYYLPEIGRFLQRDPAQADQALYRYARQNPTDYLDPSGQIAWWWLCAIPCGAHVGALAAAALGCIGAPDWDACMHEVLSDPEIKCKYGDIAGAACLACLGAGLLNHLGGKNCPLTSKRRDVIGGVVMWTCIYTCQGGRVYARYYPDTGAGSKIPGGCPPSISDPQR